ncbi:zinc finger protein 830 [Anopheles aquasalis]|uniref:zinc finger protein 830 n=1 Tax=Anopheles aquasalis TaxID=42839 RepID=UPI00215B2331|nr:zinc finger protein 830 [Anopheles aquasalis]
MSAAFKQAKKKYSQQELRRIMSETKAKQLQQPVDGNTKRIDSPLAKYNDAGQLLCVLCRSVVRSEAVWKVHINSKQHKENIELAKQLKNPQPPPQPRKSSAAAPSVSGNNDVTVPQKRSATAGSNPDDVAPPKKLKGILKTSATREPEQNGPLPEDFFDTANAPSNIRKELVNIRLPERNREQKGEPMEQDTAEMEAAGAVPPADDEALPEGFFDDPKMDAKARNQEYKDPNDEEWDKFQKEIKEATNVSMAIISEEQEESTAERQIAEIDEQIRNWSRVLDLEKQKERVKAVKGGVGQRVTRANGNMNGASELSLRNSSAPRVNEAEADEDDDDDEEFDEFLDWRSKKSYK